MTETGPEDARPPEAPDEEDVQTIQEAIDSLRVGDPELRRARTQPRPARTEMLPENAHEAIREEVADVAYVQHTYSTDGRHVCRVGIRQDATIADDMVVVGADGVLHREEIERRVDEMRAPSAEG